MTKIKGEGKEGVKEGAKGLEVCLRGMKELIRRRAWLKMDSINL